jgi:hypothetical protein
MQDLPLMQLVTGGGPWALIALTVVSVIRGWLVPRATVERERALLEQRIAELRSAHDTAAQQVTELLEVGRTSEAVLRSLPRPKEPA